MMSLGFQVLETDRIASDHVKIFNYGDKLVKKPFTSIWLDGL